jgi:hypothetical protein
LNPLEFYDGPDPFAEVFVEVQQPLENQVVHPEVGGDVADNGQYSGSDEGDESDLSLESDAPESDYESSDSQEDLPEVGEALNNRIKLIPGKRHLLLEKEEEPDEVQLMFSPFAAPAPTLTNLSAAGRPFSPLTLTPVVGPLPMDHHLPGTRLHLEEPAHHDHDQMDEEHHQPEGHEEQEEQEDEHQGGTEAQNQTEQVQQPHQAVQRAQGPAQQPEQAGLVDAQVPVDQDRIQMFIQETSHIPMVYHIIYRIYVNHLM